VKPEPQVRARQGRPAPTGAGAANGSMTSEKLENGQRPKLESEPAQLEVGGRLPHGIIVRSDSNRESVLDSRTGFARSSVFA